MSIELNVNSVPEKLNAVQSTCDECIHKDICRYSDELDQLYEDIRTRIKHVEFISDVNIICKHRTVQSLNLFAIAPITANTTPTNVKPASTSINSTDAGMAGTTNTITVTSNPTQPKHRPAPLKMNVKDMDLSGVPIKEINPNDIPVQFRKAVTTPQVTVTDDTVKLDEPNQVTNV